MPFHQDQHQVLDDHYFLLRLVIGQISIRLLTTMYHRRGLHAFQVLPIQLPIFTINAVDIYGWLARGILKAWTLALLVSVEA